MANKALFAQLKQKFTTDTIIKRAGGKYLKVSDFNGIQAFGNLQQNTLANRYTRLYSNSSLIEPGIGYGMQITRAQLYLDYEAMDLDALVAPALDILCEEATQVNEMNNEILSIRSSSENIQDELYNLFYNVLNVEFNLPMWIRSFCKYGDFFLLLRLSDQFGVYGVKSLSPYEMVREEGLDANNGEYVRFIQDPGAIMGGVSSINQSRNHRIYENYEIAHFRLMKDSNFLPYGRCLKGNSYVETEFGVNTIDKIQEGDKVWSYNTKEDKYELTKVLKQVCSGEKEIYKVSTKNNFIEGSAEHPILVFSDGVLKYKQIQELNIKDLVAITNYSFKQPNIESKINKDVSNENKKNGWQKLLEYIPNTYEEDFARLFGFMLGDGWLSKSCVAFAQGVHDDINQKYKGILQKYSGKICGEHNKKITNTNISSQAFCHSKALNVILKNNGFTGKAKTKRFPSWIYEQPENVQLAFIEGLVDADGSTNIDEWGCNRYTVELVNKEMLEDLKVLLQRLKIKSGKIRKRKERTTVVFGDKIYNKSEAYLLSFYMEGRKLIQTKKYKQEGIENVILEPITAIEESDKELTYDIHVESENHNFIANGIVVHNSWLEPGRKLFKAYTMMEDAAVTHRVTKSAEKRVFYYNVGNLPPNEVDAMMQKHISNQKRTPLFDHKTGQFNYKFNMMNLLEDFHIPVRNGDNLTRIDTAKGLEYTGMDDMNYFINKMFSALKIPKAYLNYSDELNGKSTLSGLSLSWSRQIEYIQRLTVSQLQKIAQVHLTLLGYEDSDLANFDITLARPSILHEQERIALLKEKVDLANQMQEKNFISTDWIYDNIFQMSEDQINRERDLIAEDVKRKFRYTQIEQEGNDPALSGVSYGTPHDLASIYKNNASGPESVPDGYDEKKVIGRPVLHASSYGTDSSFAGRDPFGKKEMRDKYKKDSLRPNPRKGIYNEGLKKSDLEKIKPGKKVQLFEGGEPKELSMLDEGNLLDKD
jgi:hypothetical protein